MHIDQKGLNNLLYGIQPKNYMDMLKEKREDLMKKLNQEIRAQDDNAGDKDKYVNGSNGNNKQLISELQSLDKEIQLAVYEEKSLKLKLERLKREEATEKDLQKRERIFAKHESVLYNASMRKLISAACNASGYRTMVRGGVKLSLGEWYSETGSDSHRQCGIKEKVEDIDRDLKESVKYGMSAADVARRRKSNHMKAAAQKKAGKRKKGSINITV